VPLGLAKTTVRYAPVVVGVCLVIVLGAFFRLKNLDNNVVWEPDVALYSIMAKRYHGMIRVMKSPELRDIWHENRRPDQTTRNNLRTMQTDVRFKELTQTIPFLETHQWSNVSKPLFILAASAYRFVDGRSNAILFFTAWAGIVLIVCVFIISYVLDRSIYIALMTTGIMAISPVLVGYSRIGYAQIVAALFLTLALFSYIQSLQRHQTAYLLLSGIMWGVGFSFHPVVLPWIGFLLVYEAFVLLWRKHWKAIIPRMVAIGSGIGFSLLFVEVLQLYAAFVSLLLSEEIIHPLLYSFMKHGHSAMDGSVVGPLGPWFYIAGITFYEGIPFLIALLLAIFWFLRSKVRPTQDIVWLYFTLVPLICFSLLHGHVNVCLRNVMFVMVPAYFFIGKQLYLFIQFQMKKARKNTIVVGAALLVGVSHVWFCGQTNWSHAHIDAQGKELAEYVRDGGSKIAFASGSLFFQNLLDLPVGSPSLKVPLTLHLGLDSVPDNSHILKTFQTTGYDQNMFLVEHPRFVPLWFNADKRQHINQMVITGEVVSSD
jgi:hypothetical protein